MSEAAAVGHCGSRLSFQIDVSRLINDADDYVSTDLDLLILFLLVVGSYNFIDLHL